MCDTIVLNVPDSNDSDSEGKLQAELTRLQGFCRPWLGTHSSVVRLMSPEIKLVRWANPLQYFLWAEVISEDDNAIENSRVYISVVFYRDGSAFATPDDQGSCGEFRFFAPLASWQEGVQLLVNALHRYLQDIGVSNEVHILLSSPCHSR